MLNLHHVLADSHIAVDLVNERKVPREIPVALTTQTWGGVPYYETSARRDINVGHVFEDVLRQVIRLRSSTGALQSDEERRKKRKAGGMKCVIL